MAKRSARIISAVAAGAGMLSAISSPALAASSDGATVTKQSGCVDYGWAVVCNDIQGVYQSVQTPSGNTKYSSNGRYDYTVTFANGETYSSSGDYHYQSLWRKGDAQEYHGHFSSIGQSSYGTCTYEGDYHYANGSEQFSDFEFNCV